MPYIIYSLTRGALIAKVDAALQNVTLRDGEVAIPCLDSDSPNDPKWAEEAAQYDDKYALPNAKELQTVLISQACQAAIVTGFTSSALGTEHTYPAKPIDQQNLSASVLASLMPGVAADYRTPFWCADSTGEWAYEPHTAAQIQQVGTDGKEAILVCLTKNQELAAKIEAASTVDNVLSITWGGL